MRWLLGAERRQQKAVELIQDDRKRQDEREDQRDADRGGERLADPQRHRLVALRAALTDGVIAPLQPGLTPRMDARVAAVAPLPGRSSAPTTS